MTRQRINDTGDTTDSGQQRATPQGAAPGRGMHGELAEIRRLVAKLQADLRAGVAQPLPGNAFFLDDGRVLCRERSAGDSRYPYGSDGLHFWVNASGRMYGNMGLFFIFLPTQAGADPPVAFFVGTRRKDNGGFIPLSLLPTPFVAEGEETVVDRFSIIGPDAAHFVTVTAETCALVRVFVDQTVPDCPRIAFSSFVESLADGDQDMYFSMYMNPFCRHQFAETNEDRWFKKIAADNAQPAEVEANEARTAVLAAFNIGVNEDVSRFKSITNHALVRRALTCWSPESIDHAHVPTASRFPELLASSVCTSQRGYLGSLRRGLASASCLTTGAFGEEIPLTVFNDNAVVGDLTHFRLPGRSAVQFDAVLSLPSGTAALDEERETHISAAYVEQRFATVGERSRGGKGCLSMRIEGDRIGGVRPATLNHFFGYLKNQVAICAQTKGYMHASPNSLIGFRDVFQAIEGHLYDRPDLARAKMREALGSVMVDGRCPRQYSLAVNGAPGAADLREFIDQGVWAISAVYTYVAVTGDDAFLDQVLGYHRIDPDNGQTLTPADDRDSVLEHLIRILDYLIRHRDPQTGLVHILYGDWNDAVDGLGTTSEPGRLYGTGVSVMASLQVYQNCGEMIELIRRFQPEKYSDLAADYARVREELAQGLLEHAVLERGDERRIVHGWGDERSYYVGSFRDSDGVARDSLTSNAFWVLGGMLERDRSLRQAIIDAFRRLDSTYGLKTFRPGFAPDCPGVGRVGKLPIGTAENAATYVHATAFGIAALFLMHEAREAWRQIEKILPFAAHQGGLSHTPFVMPNSYVHNPALNLTGQNMNDWQTGSSNVLLKLLVRYVFGFQPEFDALRIAPARWSPLGGFDFRCAAHGRPVRLVLKTGRCSSRQIRFSGEQVALVADERTDAPCALLPYDRLSATEENVIEIDDPAYD